MEFLRPRAISKLHPINREVSRRDFASVTKSAETGRAALESARNLLWNRHAELSSVTTFRISALDVSVTKFEIKINKSW